MVVSFKIEDTNESGETVGSVVLYDTDDPPQGRIREEQKLGWTTLTDAEEFARKMGYDFALA